MSNLLTNIHDCIHQGEYNNALLIIDKLLTNKNPSDKTTIELGLIKIDVLFIKGNYKEGLELIDDLIKICQEKKFYLYEIDLIILHITYYIELAKYDDVLKMIFIGEEKLNKLSELRENFFLKRKSDFLYAKGQIYRHKTEIENAITLFQEALTLYKKIDNKKSISNTLSQLANMYRDQNKIDLSISLFNEALNLYMEIGDPYDKMISLKGLGSVYLLLGQRQSAKAYYQAAYKIAENIANINHMNLLNNNFGLIEEQLGNLHEAIEYYQKAINSNQDINNILFDAAILGNIGNVYIKMGNLEKALEYIRKSQEKFQILGNLMNITNSFIYLGRIYILEGNYEKALINFQLSINMMDNIPNNIFNSVSLYNYIFTAVLMNNLELANEKLKVLEKINSESSEKPIYYRTILARALILKNNTRAKSKVKAEEYFEEVISSDIPLSEEKIDAMLNLCDLKLIELKVTKDNELLKEAKDIANKVLELAKNQNSMVLLAETYWLLSQLSLIEFDFNSAKRLLIQAQLLAEEWGIRNLVLKISLEYDKLLERMDLWEQLLERNAPIHERMNMIELQDFFLKSIRDRIFEGEILPEKPVMFLLLKKSGLPVYSKKYLEENKIDDSLVSGFLAAINAFARETFTNIGPIERIKHNNYNIVIQNINHYLVCYIFYGQSYSVLQKIMRIIERIKKEEQVWEELEFLVDSSDQISNSSVKKIDNIVDGILI